MFHFNLCRYCWDNRRRAVESIEERKNCKRIQLWLHIDAAYASWKPKRESEDSELNRKLVDALERKWKAFLTQAMVGWDVYVIP
ncbi:hypothetical protein CUMW_280120 [Citrus unshiu]|uniref:Uncharacterized protein n=1 Tax=Citrus unshiu TaxID=55188 RepID=A0A2H5NAP6_CITUN|nr:hypothetical protein CUMW_280120 [Citrus unshiu]